MSKEEKILSLKETMDEAEWKWLSLSLKRDTLILVSPKFDLLDVAYKIAIDDKDSIQRWIQNGTLFKPTNAMIQAWNQLPTKKFMIIVVQPYVLAQEIPMPNVSE